MSTFAISKFCATMATAVLFVASLAPRAHAQNTELRADVPFAFQYGSDHYAAGRYTITHLSDRFIVLRSKSKAGAVMVQSSYGAATTTGKLVFNRYGNRYFLEQIWTPNEGTHLECIKTRTEQLVRKELTVASNTAPPATVEMVSLQAAVR